METKDSTEALIASFHRTWDAFPGIARLIDRQHRILASNPMAAKAGFTVGAICAKIGEPTTHRECKMGKMFETGKSQTDQVIPGRIRGWFPVEGFPDFCIHFGLPISEEKG